MDETVDDFLNEINVLTPNKPKKSECVWQECNDERTGFSYYWNMETDEVTWEEPQEYKHYKELGLTKKPKSKTPKDLYVPPKFTPQLRDPVKIYRVGNDSQQCSPASSKLPDRLKAINARKKPPSISNYSDDSEDEKITLITSYGGDTDSEEEKIIMDTKKQPTVKLEQSQNIRESDSDNEIEEDILSKIQKRAKELKALGGQLPPGVEKIVDKAPEFHLPKVDPDCLKTKKDISGFSLVAGYGDSDEEQESAEVKSLFPIATNSVQENKISHSTLFPISKPIDIKDFSTAPSNFDQPVEFDTKQFQRKRRIGIDLVNARKPQIEEKHNIPRENEHRGLGFNNITEPAKYPGFKSGGVMFIKSDVLNPQVSDKVETEASEGENNNTNNDKETVNKNDVVDTYTTLKEKLSFLSEGRAPVSPVQEMIIQIETLYTAMKDGSLKLAYLHKWLTDTCADLIKLEKEASPEGWLLLWDRSHKRYYYQNQHTGESQWNYPQPDVVRCDEAMDICTTPPPCPTYQEVELTPPLPPKIRSPSPPPPPIISHCDEKENFVEPPLPDIKVPIPPPPPTHLNDEQPLPPGVDHTEETFNKKESDPNLSSVLDSFYSDIAALETLDSPNPSSANVIEEMNLIPNFAADLAPHFATDLATNFTTDLATNFTTNLAPSLLVPVLSTEASVSEPPKKKKKKVKLTEGLSMKKKGVSKLVEKWKNVQKSLND